jgi:1-acyl-sn-glycerol-3-phosphate acyltransferase
VLRAMTDEIMYEIMKLSGQEYVDDYAQRAKLGLPLARRNRGRGPAEDGSSDRPEPEVASPVATSADES